MTKNTNTNMFCSTCQRSAVATAKQCSNCGGNLKSRTSRPRVQQDELSPTAKIYTAFFMVFGLIFPFLIPIILKVSHANL